MHLRLVRPRDLANDLVDLGDPGPCLAPASPGLDTSRNGAHVRMRAQRLDPRMVDDARRLL
eukprot:12112522-Alexandrium_andersonii.AAC.1